MAEFFDELMIIAVLATIGMGSFWAMGRVYISDRRSTSTGFALMFFLWLGGMILLLFVGYWFECERCQLTSEFPWLKRAR